MNGFYEDCYLSGKEVRHIMDSGGWGTEDQRNWAEHVATSGCSLRLILMSLFDYLSETEFNRFGATMIEANNAAINEIPLF